MRQIGKELWIENREAGWLIGKTVLVLFMIFGGILIRDYPYSIIGMFMLCSMELSAIKTWGQIDYILPQTEREKKRNVIIKSAVIGGIYSLANTTGYICFILAKADCDWNAGLVVFMVYMTVELFLFYFCYRLELFRGEGSRKINLFGRTKAEKFQSALKLVLDGLGSLLSAFTCLIYIMYRFGGVRFPAFLVQNERKLELIFGALALVLMSRSVIGSIRSLDYSEYMED